MSRLESCDECMAQKFLTQPSQIHALLSIHDSRFNEPFNELVGLMLPRRRPVHSGVKMACLVPAIPFQTNLSLVRVIHWPGY
jgi:hypothetical protein